MTRRQTLSALCAWSTQTSQPLPRPQPNARQDGHRPYKAERRAAPELRDILSQRAAGYGLAQITEAFGVHRRTVYLAIDRAADRGELPPALLWVLFPEDEDARRRLYILDGVSAITAIIEHGRLVESLPSRPEKDDRFTCAWHRLEAKVEVGGEVRTYRVLVREDLHGAFHYRLEAERSEMETPHASVQADQQGKTGAGTDAQGAVLNLEEAPAQINPRGQAEADTATDDPEMTPAALAELTDILGKIVGPEVVVEQGKTGHADGVAAGQLIRLSFAIGEGRAHWVGAHEAIHTFRNLGQITPREWSVVTTAAARGLATPRPIWPGRVTSR